MPELRSLHVERTANNPEFNYLREAFAYRKAQSENSTVSLNEAERLAEKNDREAYWVALENKKRSAMGMDLIASLDDLNEDADSETLASNEPTPEQPATAGGAIVPEEGSSENGDPVPGSEMAGNGPGPESARTAKEEKPEDPYLVETGHILLDLMSLEERTAADRKRHQGS